MVRRDTPTLLPLYRKGHRWATDWKIGDGRSTGCRAATGSSCICETPRVPSRVPRDRKLCVSVQRPYWCVRANTRVCACAVTSPVRVCRGNGGGRLTDRTTSLIRMMGVLLADPDGRIQRLYNSSKNWEQEWMSTPARCFLQSTQDERPVSRGAPITSND